MTGRDMPDLRFVPGGPAIPGKLVVDQELGRVVFVCGAGVSMTAGLPSFRSLVEGMYSALGEGWETHHAEREVMVSSGRLAGQYDRALRCLERRLAAHDVRSAGGLRGRIREAVDSRLRPGTGVGLPNHLALLQLSRGPDNSVRLLTTNFDTLFERACLADTGRVPASHAGAAMPRQGTAAFEGVLHLHGRIGDADLALAGTDLVLTSAEFGDAYLRSGWAARYVYDLARASTLVLVGYQADDPPMRYLLEVLEDDRARFPDLKRVYAFAPAGAGKEELERAMWRAKGIEPILYASGNPGDHDRLYATLLAWSDYAAAPSAWRERRLSAIFSKPFGPGPEAGAAEAEGLLAREDAGVLLDRLRPGATWWLPISGGLARRGKADALVPWVAGRLADPDMLAACVVDRPACLPWEGILWALDRAGADVPPGLARGWRLLAAAERGGTADERSLEWVSASQDILAGKSGRATRLAAVGAVRPRLRVGRPFEWSRADGTAPAPIRLPYRVDFEPDGHVSADEILRAWPDDVLEEAALLAVADRALDDALDEAADAGHLEGFDRASYDVRSLVATGAPGMEHGFQPLARLVAGLWGRVCDKDPGLARSRAAGWANGAYDLRRRLHMHALASPDVFRGDEAWSALAGLDDDSFWLSGSGREVAALLEGRWGDLSPVARESLVGRILAGPPAALYPSAPGNDEAGTRVVDDYLIYRRLEPVRRSGGELPPEATRFLDRIAASYPAGSIPLPDEDGKPAGGRLPMDARDPGSLAGLADEALVPEVLRSREGGGYGAWGLLCEADPSRALRAVATVGAAGRTREFLWPLLSAAGESGADGLQDGVAELLRDMPAIELGTILPPAASWIWQRAGKASPGSEMPDRMAGAWDLLATIQFAPEPGPETGAGATMDEALNSTAGTVALALLAWLGKSGRAPGRGFGPEFTARLDVLARAPGKAGLHARMLLVRDLTFLHHVDPDWAAGTVVPMFEPGRSEAPCLWDARAGHAACPAALFNATKNSFLWAVQRRGDERRGGRLLVLYLLEIARRKQESRGGDYDLGWPETRSALSRAPRPVRTSASWLLWRWADEKGGNPERAIRWRSWLGPLFGAIWPLDADARDPATSRNLALMAMSCGDACAEAVEAVADFIVPFDIVTVDGWLRPFGQEPGAGVSPHALLRLLDLALGPDPARIPLDLGPTLDGAVSSGGSAGLGDAFARLQRLRRRANG